MTTPFAPHEHADLRARLRDFHEDYVACLDAGDLDGWVRFFTDDAHYRIVSLENFREDLPLSAWECQGIGALRDRVAALRETTVFEPRTLRRLVSGVRVTAVQGSEVRAEASFAVLESLSDRETHVFLTGRYLDLLVPGDDGAPRLRRRTCVYDNWRIRTSLVYPV